MNLNNYRLVSILVIAAVAYFLMYKFEFKWKPTHYISIEISWRKPLSDGSISGYLELCLQVPGTSRCGCLTVHKLLNTRVHISLTLSEHGELSSQKGKNVSFILYYNIHHTKTGASYSTWEMHLLHRSRGAPHGCERSWRVSKLNSFLSVFHAWYSRSGGQREKQGYDARD